MGKFAGKTIRGYEFREMVGRGELAEVYRAYNPALGRDVAIKVIFPVESDMDESVNQDFIYRFETEAKIVARMEHPHIIPLYNFWADPVDGAFLVMRFIEGSTLQSLIKQGEMALQSIVHILENIMSALIFAHGNHVVHRDLKPSNIIVDTQGSAYLTEFGVARNIGSVNLNFVGTVKYAAPEQLRLEAVSPSSDIYSLGIIMFEMLTGIYPFGDGLSPKEMMQKHLHEPVPNLPDHLPSALNDIIERATEKETAKRFQNIEEMAKALKKIEVEDQSEAYIDNRYLIQNYRASGSFGDIYKGQDIKTGQAVAIKFLKLDAIDKDAKIIKRFLNEGKALQQLNHPNIVKVFDSGKYNDKYYIAMEYVESGDLEELLETARHLSLRQALKIALKLSDALNHIHTLSVFHRDLKPANILISDEYEPLIIDFGIAHMGNMTRMTSTGVSMGTPAYMSPEMLNGEQVDARCDIWALAVIMIEMITGFCPFSGDTPIQILTSILHHDPIPALITMKGDVPIELEELLGKMLEKDRNQRIASMQQVGGALEAIIKQL